jgi:hypothetical protein
MGDGKKKRQKTMYEKEFEEVDVTEEVLFGRWKAG